MLILWYCGHLVIYPHARPTHHNTGNRTYVPCIYVLNKIDQLTIEELDIIDQLPHHVPISAHQGWNLGML